MKLKLSNESLKKWNLKQVKFKNYHMSCWKAHFYKPKLREKPSLNSLTVSLSHHHHHTTSYNERHCHHSSPGAWCSRRGCRQPALSVQRLGIHPYTSNWIITLFWCRIHVFNMIYLNDYLTFVIICYDGHLKQLFTSISDLFLPRKNSLIVRLKQSIGDWSCRLRR